MYPLIAQLENELPTTIHVKNIQTDGSLVTLNMEADRKVTVGQMLLNFADVTLLENLSIPSMSEESDEDSGTVTWTYTLNAYYTGAFLGEDGHLIKEAVPSADADADTDTDTDSMEERSRPMNRIKISDSDKRLLLIFCAIVIVACSYFFIFSKGMSKAAKIEEQNTADQAKVQQMEQMEAGLPKVKENIQRMVKKQKTIISTYPSAMTTEKAIESLQAYEDNSSDFHITDITFTMNQPLAVDVQTDGTDTAAERMLLPLPAPWMQSIFCILKARVRRAHRGQMQQNRKRQDQSKKRSGDIMPLSVSVMRQAMPD